MAGFANFCSEIQKFTQESGDILAKSTKGIAHNALEKIILPYHILKKSVHNILLKTQFLNSNKL